MLFSSPEYISQLTPIKLPAFITTPGIIVSQGCGAHEGGGTRAAVHMRGVALGRRCT
jgi:hypothetical protein